MSLTTFQFSATVNEHATMSACLGTAVAPLTSKDKNKAVKLAALNNFVLCSANDEIEGFVYSVEPGTKNGGFGFGAVQTQDWMEAEVGTGPVAIGDLVVADAQLAVGTAGLAKVKTGAPTKYLWRVFRFITGSGAATSKVLLHRE